MIDDCSAIILAGGNSQRMGSDKTRLMLDGQPLLERVAATMQQLFCDVVLSVRQRRDDIDLPQVCDDPAFAGPLAGWLSGMERIRTSWAFVIAGDMPFVEPLAVELLASRRGGCQAVVAAVHGHPQPLAAFYARDCLGAVRAGLASGGSNSMRAVLERLQVCYVSEEDLLSADPMLRSFVDLDTPADYRRALNIRESGI